MNQKTNKGKEAVNAVSVGRETVGVPPSRPPVVVVLGHVDHGKTRLLDTIRKTNVAAKESGGITQHIGAYQAEVSGPSIHSTTAQDGELSRTTDSVPKKLITFLDTPGHEAFTAIRSRGAKIADIAILVVAADESIKPQTKEAIRIIKEAKIPFIVAINKIDKESANPQKVRQDLAAEDVLVEDWGGKVPVVEISAKQGQNINALLELLLLVAELEELHEDLNLPAKGVIIESNLDKRRGYVATALVIKGILSVGDWMTVGTMVGKVKSMEDFIGQPITQAVPSQPVVITGWTAAPDIGREFVATKVKKQADELAADNVNLNPLFAFLSEPMPEPSAVAGGKKILNIVFKSDVTSSLEAIESALSAIRSDQVGYRVLSYGVGNISEADIKTAMTGRACVFGFRVGVESSAQKLTEKEGIKIETYDIIYELIEAVRRNMADLLEPEIKHLPLGKLRVLALFKKEGRTQIVGGRVTDGKVTRGALVGIAKPNSTLPMGRLIQLQQNKEDVSEAAQGTECGLRIELNSSDAAIKEGDILEIYEEEKTKRSL